MSQEQKVVSDAEKCLDGSSHLFRRSVSCAYRDGVLRLDGKVPTFYLKQIAQSLAAGVEGVDRIENALIVVNPYGVSSEPAAA